MLPSQYSTIVAGCPNADLMQKIIMDWSISERDEEPTPESAIAKLPALLRIDHVILDPRALSSLDPVLQGNCIDLSKGIRNCSNHLWCQSIDTEKYSSTLVGQEGSAIQQDTALALLRYAAAANSQAIALVTQYYPQGTTIFGFSQLAERMKVYWLNT